MYVYVHNILGTQKSFFFLHKFSLNRGRFMLTKGHFSVELGTHFFELLTRKT
ncbi:hypothetical protein HanIR_Chr09g0419971 [Helianthus annuus]|nr:hypothetical protein HanIR_Chr09g0419971 [Helianthus annuus]